MFGKVIETFGTEDRSFVCECPVCKTDHVIKVGNREAPVKAGNQVFITTDIVDVDGITADGKYVATHNKVDVKFHIVCTVCKVSFTSVVRSSFLVNAITEQKD